MATAGGCAAKPTPLPPRVLLPDSPEKAYVPRHKAADGGERAAEVHWGQRKLLMTEIEFLARCVSRDTTTQLVVYAGAAPAIHTPLLERLFPQCEFVLVDPAPFAISPSPRITLVRGLFTDDMAASYAGRDAILVSDIRTQPPDEDHVAADMARQQRWYRLMRPRWTMLKFRLPWRPGTTRYLDGVVFLQPYVGGRSTETRLIIDGPDAKERDWDNGRYERQCFFHNTETRLQEFPHGVCGSGLTHSWDCAREVAILRGYFSGALPTWPSLSREEQDSRVAQLSWKITDALRGQHYNMWCRRANRGK